MRLQGPSFACASLNRLGLPISPWSSPTPLQCKRVVGGRDPSATSIRHENYSLLSSSSRWNARLQRAQLSSSSNRQIPLKWLNPRNFSSHHVASRWRAIAGLISPTSADPCKRDVEKLIIHALSRRFGTYEGARKGQTRSKTRQDRNHDEISAERTVSGSRGLGESREEPLSDHRTWYRETREPADGSESTLEMAAHVRESSMTGPEREIFDRLLKNLVKDAAQDPLDQRLEKEEMYDFEADMDSDELGAADEAKIAAFPHSLQAAARQALERIARKRYAQENTSVVVRKAKEMAKPIRDAMLAAKTDAQIWSIVEEELFDRYRRYHLDSKTGSTEMPNEGSGKMTDTPGDGELEVSLPVFSHVYQRLLVFAQRLLCRRTVYSPYAFALLPAVKALGRASYVMGASPGLFNELIRYHWRATSTMTPVLALLREMDQMLCPMNLLTLEALEDITLYRWRALRGEFGPVNQTLESLPDRTREGEEIWQWKKRIQSSFVEAELERVRRRELEEELLKDGAISSDAGQNKGTQG